MRVVALYYFYRQEVGSFGKFDSIGSCKVEEEAFITGAKHGIKTRRTFYNTYSTEVCNNSKRLKPSTNNIESITKAAIWLKEEGLWSAFEFAIEDLKEIKAAIISSKPNELMDFKKNKTLLRAISVAMLNKELSAYFNNN